MSITNRLFRKAVKVLRNRGKSQDKTRALSPGFAVPGAPRFEPMEPRLLLSTVTIAAIDDANEGGLNGTFRITRDDTVGDLQVNFSRAGTAKFGATRDYTLSDGVNLLTGSVIIPDGQSFVDITVLANDDLVAESTETATLKLRSSKNYDLDVDISTRSASIDVNDNEPTVTIVATDGLADEDGDTGTFTITRAGNTTGDLEVKFKRSGNAKFGKDYGLTVGGIALTSTTVTIPDGDASVEIVVVPINDSRFENTELVNLTLRSSSAYNLGDTDTAALVAIEDNEPLIFLDPASETAASFTIDNQTDLGADTFIITGSESNETHDAGPTFRQFSRDGFLLINQNRALEVRNAEGVDGAQSRKAYVSFDLDEFPISDFSNAFFTLTIISSSGESPNNTGFKFNVFGLKDDFEPTGNEQDELWNEDIDYGDAPGNAAAGGAVDLDDMFSGGPLGSFTVVGTGTIGEKVTISGQLLTDYLNAESTLDDDNVVTFIIVRETVGEPGVDTVVHMFDGRDDPFGDATTRPQLTGVGVTEGLQITEGDATSLRVFRTGSTVGDVTVNFKVKGRAKLGVDYQLEVDGVPVTKSFVMPDGESFVDLDIIALTDDFYEIPESFEITLRPDGAYVLESQARTTLVTIVDNRPMVTVEATDDEAQEPSVTTPNLDRGTFTITRTGDTDDALEVNIRFTGTAREGTDFVTVGRTVVIPAGQESVEVHIDPLADTIPDRAETVTLSIVPSREYAVGFLLQGNRRSTGNPIRPTEIAASSLKQARRLAKDMGIGAPRLTTPNQSATVIINSGELSIDDIELLGLLYQLVNTTLDDASAGGAIGTVRIRNQGFAKAGPFNVSYYLSTDRELDTDDDVRIGGTTVIGLGAGASLDVAIIYDNLALLGLDPGDYYLITDIDDDSFVDEAIEDNNAFVSVNPDITIE